MYEMKYSDWMAIAEHINGVRKLGVIDQQRYSSYLTYSHEELIDVDNYSIAYRDMVTRIEAEARLATVEEEIEGAKNIEPKNVDISAAKNPTIEIPPMKDNSVAETLISAMAILNATNFKVLSYILLKGEAKTITASAKEISMDIRTYKKAISLLVEGGWI